MLSELALIFQQVRGSLPQLCHEAVTRNACLQPDRICLVTTEPGETEQAGFESSQLDMLPERISPRVNRARYSS